MYELKTYRGVMCYELMKMKNSVKFQKELTCYFKTDMRNLTNFDPSTQRSRKFAL